MLMSDPTDYLLYVDPALCVGCHSCEMACVLSHSPFDSFADAALNGIKTTCRLHVVQADQHSLPVFCHQCSNAPCVRVCPTKACQHSAAGVIIDTAHCIGCKTCALACPFGMIDMVQQLFPSGQVKWVAQKCDLCADWRRRKNTASTACIESCPTQAIKLVNLSMLRQKRLQASANMSMIN